VGGQRKSEPDDAVGPAPETADEKDRAAPIEGMEGAAVSMGPRGEIILDNSGPAGGDRTEKKSTGRTARTTEPDDNNHPSIAVNEEPSG
jgi:hypothetical protein